MDIWVWRTRASSWQGSEAAGVMMTTHGPRQASLTVGSGIIPPGTRPSPKHQPTRGVATTVNMASADLKYYELYRRSRYCARLCESGLEHAR